MPAFTTIAATASLAATVGTTGMSFVQAANQRRLQNEAEAKAAEAMAAAQKKLQVNFYDTLAVQKDAYEMEKEALLAAGAQAIEAAKESDRGVGATAGRVQMAQTEGQRKVAAALGQELAGYEKMSAAEDARLRDARANLDLAVATGAQQAAADAATAENAAITQGMAGVTSAMSQAASMVPLYSKGKSTRAMEDVLGAFGEAGIGTDVAGMKSYLNSNYSKYGITPDAYSKVESLDQMKSYLIGLDPEVLKKMQSGISGFYSNVPQQSLNPLNDWSYIMNPSKF